MTKPYSSRDVDLRSLALHRLVVQKIQADPQLFAKAQAMLERMEAEASMATLPYVLEWRRCFDEGIAEALAIAVEDSERGQTLRSTSPFPGILDDRERIEVLKSAHYRLTRSTSCSP